MQNFVETGRGSDLEIAIVGMAGRFPGAKNIKEFWENLHDGKEAITFFSDQDLLDAGVAPSTLSDSDYVKANGVLEGIEFFDASFFGYSPREAEVMDPQHRFFLECAWEALEDAGYDVEAYTEQVGVYAGTSTSSYLSYLLANSDILSSIDALQLRIAHDKDYVSTRVSYKLNLTGPGITIQTACSTSLVAVHLACQGLISGDCDIALAGGVSISVPQNTGYLYQEGGIVSPDGHCRAFDARAQGTVSGSGVGIVVLKRLEDAVAEGDHIRAIIKGSAIGNDGATKVGYTAPSINGQAKVIRKAYRSADIHPQSVSYVEMHGTGTPLGDPIEVAALTQAFRTETQSKGFCAIGSVKTNIGHLDAAAGIAGLIKTTLALEHKMLPPSLHYDKPNPKLDLENSPFYVNSSLVPWFPQVGPRRAGISSFGIGGTNAHILLEEAPTIAKTNTHRTASLLLLSARTPQALERATANLAAYIELHPTINIGDVAYTLQVGRKIFDHRRIVTCHNAEDALCALKERDPQNLLTTVRQERNLTVVFMFPGGGAQYSCMGIELYHTEPIFQKQVDICALALKRRLDIDIRDLLFPNEELVEEASQRLQMPSLALPALFTIEFALAKLWMSWGVVPEAMIGHSLGEYVAACLADVMSLENALSLVALRGELFEQLPKGAMLSVPLSEQELLSLLSPGLSIAAVNGTSNCVASGPIDDILLLKKALACREVTTHILPIAVAAHSAMVTPILESFTGFVETLQLHPPRIPYISNVTGTWITADEATNPLYWTKHLRQTVRFAEGLQTLFQNSSRLFLEIGPGNTLSTLVKFNQNSDSERETITSLRHPSEKLSDSSFLLMALGQLWLAGIPVDWSRFSAHEQHRRIPLPTYPFEHQRYWIDPQHGAQAEMIDQIQEINKDLKHSPQASSLPLHPRPPLQSVYIAPRDAVEQDIATVWQALLGIKDIGIHDSFFELGGHSLLATQLVVSLREKFMVNIPTRVVLGSPTIAAFAQTIQALLRGESASTIAPHKDLQSEVVLDAGISTRTISFCFESRPATLLLTGATGYVGAFLLNELLLQTHATIYCLIRASSHEEGMQRIRHRLEYCQLWNEQYVHRIVPILGDLSQVRLGLSEQQFATIAQVIEMIYHCGASVHFSYPYEMLKATNVLGTEEIIRLACHGRVKPIHYISTISVFSTIGYADTEIVYEDDLPVHSEYLLTGYSQSKWVAERLAVLARSRGVPISIYRLGAVTGDSTTGICNTNDATWRIIKGCIQLGYIPDRDTLEYLTPADYMSKTLVYLSQQQESLGHTFHLVTQIPTNTLFNWICSLGYSLTQIPYEDWRNRLITITNSAPDNALYPLIPLITESFEVRAKPLVFDSQNTRTALGTSTIHDPKLDSELIKKYFSYFVRSGFLEEPGTRENKPQQTAAHEGT